MKDSETQALKNKNSGEYRNLLLKTIICYCLKQVVTADIITKNGTSKHHVSPAVITAWPESNPEESDKSKR